jgi:hypothetical protein
MMAWLLLNPLRSAALAIIIALAAGLGIATLQVRAARQHLQTAIAERALAQAQAQACSAGVESLERSAAQARQNSAKALAAARAESGARQPAIDALAAASQASGTLTCGDAIDRVRDALK